MKSVWDSYTEEEFEEVESKLQEIWSSRGVLGVTFSHYLRTYKEHLMEKCMNGQIREQCGLGSPAQEYDQNAYKCENSVIKKLKESKCWP